MQKTPYWISLPAITAVVLLLALPSRARPQHHVGSSAPASSSKAKPIADSKKRLSFRLTLTDGIHWIKRSRKQLGFSLASNAPVRFAANRAVLKVCLRHMAPVFAASAVDAKPSMIHGKFSIHPGACSRSLNVATTAEKIISAVTAKPATRIVRVALNKKPPAITPGVLKGISGRLSQFSTIAVGPPARNNNIDIAVDSIDGTLLSPGEEFSLNQTVGKRTKARGFEVAHVFVDARVVKGVGGGVSQVTGTLFNAVALAGLKIIEVNPHSRPVAYLPIGRDATVAYGAEDLKFKNNTRRPVYITYTFTHRRLTATVWGAPVHGRKISLRPRVHHLGPGKVDADLYRVIKFKGRLVSKEHLFHHSYRWKPGEK